MVYRGPSRACEACRRRRVKCDERLPQCGNCIKRKTECPGYRDAFAARLRDETQLVSQRKPFQKQFTSSDQPPERTSKGQKTSLDDSSTCTTVSPVSRRPDVFALYQSPSANHQVDALHYFITCYVDIPRDPSTNVWIEHILPLYNSAAPESALVHALNAVSTNIYQMWTSLTIDSLPARESYGKAISAVNAALRDPVESKSDQVLAAVYLLDFYDNLNRRYINLADSGTHQQGAVALLRHRGEDNFKTTQSRRLFVSLRSRHINYCLARGRTPLLDHRATSHHLMKEFDDLPSARLDNINGDLAELHAFARIGHKAALMSETEYYTEMLSRGREIEHRLQQWCDTLPPSWQPVAVPVETLHQSVRDAGVYGDRCDVYSSLSVSHVRNGQRSSHVSMLRAMLMCIRELQERGCPVDPELVPYACEQIQRIVDDFCASVPYHLGSRTTLTYPHEPCEYPYIPESLRNMASFCNAWGEQVQLTMDDHRRAATAIGGWFILIPLTTFLQPFPLTPAKAVQTPCASKLRDGQYEWIRDQWNRVRHIYRFPDNSTQAMIAEKAIFPPWAPQRWHVDATSWAQMGSGSRAWDEAGLRSMCE